MVTVFYLGKRNACSATFTHTKTLPVDMEVFTLQKVTSANLGAN
jgi:hypothetical protein